jgi:hypothetical protein
MTSTSHHFIIRTLMPTALGVVCLVFVGLGLYALLRRRPFVMRARWMLLLLLITFTPSIGMQLSLMFDAKVGESLGLLSVIGPLIFVILIVYFALSVRGYLVFGTTQDSFRDALVAALASLNLPFEESLSTLRLPTVPAELQVAVQGWIGTGQLRLKGQRRQRILADIASAMTGQFNSGRYHTNMATAILYLIMGLLMGATVVALVTAV